MLLNGQSFDCSRRINERLMHIEGVRAMKACVEKTRAMILTLFEHVDTSASLNFKIFFLSILNMLLQNIYLIQFEMSFRVFTTPLARIGWLTSRLKIIILVIFSCYFAWLDTLLGDE